MLTMDQQKQRNQRRMAMGAAAVSVALMAGACGGGHTAMRSPSSTRSASGLPNIGDPNGSAPTSGSPPAPQAPVSPTPSPQVSPTASGCPPNYDPGLYPPERCLQPGLTGESREGVVVTASALRRSVDSGQPQLCADVTVLNKSDDGSGAPGFPGITPGEWILRTFDADWQGIRNYSTVSETPSKSGPIPIGQSVSSKECFADDGQSGNVALNWDYGGGDLAWLAAQ